MSAAFVEGKGTGEHETLDFDVTGERREFNSLINDIRRRIDLAPPA